MSKPNTLSEGLISYWSFNESDVPSDESIKYGYLYNWWAAINAKGIANDGWSVPTVANFNTLSTYVGSDPGDKLKETGLTHWRSGDHEDVTNSSGFTGRGAGERYEDGSFVWLKDFHYMWTSQQYNSSRGYARNLQYNGSVFPSIGRDKDKGFSIRLIKDSTNLNDGETGTYTGNDGRVYNTVCIGTQEWISENLIETKYNDGSSIPEITNNTDWTNDTTGARCSFNNNENNAIEITVNTNYDIHRDVNSTVDGATWQEEAGKIGDAYYFDGVDDYINMGDTIYLDGLSNISASAWVNTSGVSGPSIETIISKYMATGNQRVFGLFLTTSNQLRCTIYGSDGDADYINVVATNPIPLSEWVHVSFTFDGSDLKLFVNGEYQNATTTVNGSGTSQIYNKSSKLYIGAVEDGFTTPDYLYNGDIDELGIWNRALTEKEIASLYNSGNGLEYNKFRYGNI